MLIYHPEKFKSLSLTPIGLRMWAFLNRDNIVQLLETKSADGYPAVMGIENEILEEFGDALQEERLRQMIGHMVRQILEARGWQLDQMNVKTTSAPFTKAARYTHPSRISAHIFRNAANRFDLCMTNTRSAAALPPIDSGWTHAAHVDSTLKMAFFGIRDPKAALNNIAQHGYHRQTVTRMSRAG